MIAFPYVALPRVNGPIVVQPYGLLLLVGCGLAVITAWRLSRRFGIPARDWALLPIAIATAFAGGHIYDVIFYQWGEASRDPALWVKLFQGISLMGALIGVVAFVVPLVLVRKLGGRFVDVVAVSCLVAMTVGRVACALVHDHPGIPTDSVLGIDTPNIIVSWALPEARHLETIRIHDLGFEELLALLPMLAAAFLWIGRLRPGMTAALVAIAYAAVRFPLDFLRLPATEPMHLGLTGGQWGCIVLLVAGGIGLGLTLARRPQSGRQ